MMKRYEREIANLEANTPQFYYPYSVKVKSDYGRELLVLYFRKNGPMRTITKQELNDVDENMKVFSGEYVFHYNDPAQTEDERKSYVRAGALNHLGRVEFAPFQGLSEERKNHVRILEEGKDFEICIGDRVDIQQPKTLTFDDLPDLMGIEKEIKSFEGVES